MSIIVSAPGKIHLMGEHAVVYGKPALLAAINRRLFVQIDSLPDGAIEIICNGTDNLVRYVLEVMKSLYHLDRFPGMRLTISSTIPVGSGLGSSAALAVATLGALHLFLNKGWNKTRINELAYEVEKKQHGNPSGGDNTVVTFGGLLWYRREFEFLKSIWQIPIRLNQTTANKFVLVDSGRPLESTKEMIELVSSKFPLAPRLLPVRARRQTGRRADKVPSLKLERIFNDQEMVTKRMVLALKEDDEAKLMANIRRGERNLEKLGMVGKKATLMIRIIKAAHGVAKICGAGGIKEGSGMLLAYHPRPRVLMLLAKKKHWSVMRVTMAEEGVRQERNISAYAEDHGFYPWMNADALSASADEIRRNQ